MFFKKQTPQHNDQSPATNDQATATHQTAPAADAEPTKPIYQKPVLRRYDQIEQVKPYGPSEI